MPIRFRCSACSHLLGIARRKAGTETICPRCAAKILVPQSEETEDNSQHLEDIDDMINPASAPSTTPARSTPAMPVVATRTAPPPAPRSASKPVVELLPIHEAERPLFERDVDSVLGVTNQAQDAAAAAGVKPAATSGMDAMSLGSERGHLVLSAQKATALVVAVVVLLALSFGAGFLIASR